MWSVLTVDAFFFHMELKLWYEKERYSGHFTMDILNNFTLGYGLAIMV